MHGPDGCVYQNCAILNEITTPGRMARHADFVAANLV